MATSTIHLSAEELRGRSAPRLIAQGERAVMFARGERLDAGALPGGDEAELLRLVRRVQAGDRPSFERLYRLTREDAARTLSHLVGNQLDVEDLLQETYLRLLTALKGFRGEARFRTFFHRVCANVALSHLRWKRRRPEDSFAEPPETHAPDEDPEHAAARRQAARLVEEALERLKPKKRLVFVYYELWGMTPDEIAQAVGSSTNTVRSRLYHARREFHEALARLSAPGSRPR